MTMAAEKPCGAAAALAAVACVADPAVTAESADPTELLMVTLPAASTVTAEIGYHIAFTEGVEFRFSGRGEGETYFTFCDVDLTPASSEMSEGANQNHARHLTPQTHSRWVKALMTKVLRTGGLVFKNFIDTSFDWFTTKWAERGSRSRRGLHAPQQPPLATAWVNSATWSATQLNKTLTEWYVKEAMVGDLVAAVVAPKRVHPKPGRFTGVTKRVEKMGTRSKMTITIGDRAQSKTCGTAEAAGKAFDRAGIRADDLEVALRPTTRSAHKSSPMAGMGAQAGQRDWS